MARQPRILVFIGIKDFVVALDAATGSEVWRAELKGSDFVTVCWDGEILVAANSGEVYRIDPDHGTILWNNPLKGLGRGLVTLATSRAPVQGADVTAAGAMAAKKKRDQQAAVAASAAAAS